MIKASMEKDSSGTYTLAKGINSKVNVITPVEFELAYYKVVVKFFNHYTTVTPLNPRLE